MNEHDRSQLGAYALGALEPDEAREVDEHLATCPECRTELADLEELTGFLGEVPPEAFLDGPPEDGDLLLQRTLREVRRTPAPRKRRRSAWLLVAAAAAVVAGTLGGGVVIGRQTVNQAEPTPPPGTKQVTATDVATGSTMDTTVEPRIGWSYIQVHLTGVKAGTKCQLLVTDKSGKTWTAGSWVVSDKAAREGGYFGGGVLVPLDQVHSVEIKTLDGRRVVATTI